MVRPSKCPGCKTLRSAHSFGKPGKFCTGPSASQVNGSDVASVSSGADVPGETSQDILKSLVQVVNNLSAEVKVLKDEGKQLRALVQPISASEALQTTAPSAPAMEDLRERAEKRVDLLGLVDSESEDSDTASSTGRRKATAQASAHSMSPVSPALHVARSLLEEKRGTSLQSTVCAMSGCLDDAHCPSFESVTERRNLISSIVGGSLFFIGWWILIDVAVTKQFEPAFHIPGVVSSVAVFMINAVSNAQVRGDSFSYNGGCIGQTGARLWLIFSFLLAFGGLFAACLILFGAYVVPDKDDPWPGVFIFLQNALIFFSAIVFKFGRKKETW